jgi:hypothetical protein
MKPVHAAQIFTIDEMRLVNNMARIKLQLTLADNLHNATVRIERQQGQMDPHFVLVCNPHPTFAHFVVVNTSLRPDMFLS